MARRQLTLDNTVAAELAGSEDTILRELRGRLDCDLHLRGNVLTLDGEPRSRVTVSLSVAPGLISDSTSGGGRFPRWETVVEQAPSASIIIPAARRPAMGGSKRVMVRFPCRRARSNRTARYPD